MGNSQDLSFVLDITLVAIIIGKKYSTEDYGWGLLAVVSCGTSRVVRKVIEKIVDLEKKGKALEAAAKSKIFTKY
ncbi:hypothetical protein ABE069_04405 [Bacillus mycoides]